jgi:predicted O-methyltransferase YrrM
MYAYGDAASLYAMLRHFRPNRIIEVGSGYSTALMLDYGDQWQNELQLTSVEPYPDRLLDQLKPDDLKNKLTLKQQRLEEISLNLFKTLKANDILFIDSSHVSKLGSDVNYYIFNILPRLNPGVIIHIHDIIWPFEFSDIKENRFWNEPYLVRAFLENNPQFEIIFWPSYLKTKQAKALKPYPQFNTATYGPGGAIWLRKKI